MVLEDLLIRHHESEDFAAVASLRPANQAVAFARMSRAPYELARLPTQAHQLMSLIQSAKLNGLAPDEQLPFKIPIGYRRPSDYAKETMPGTAMLR